MRKIRLTGVWFFFGEVLFGLWLFDWLPSKPPAWLTEGPEFDPSISDPELIRLVYLWLLILISIGPFFWIDTFRFYRRSFFPDLKTMLKLNMRSKQGLRRVFVILLLMGTTTSMVLQGIPWDSYLVRISFLAICATFLIFMLPPTAIVLGSSDNDLRFLYEIAAALFPLRIVTLFKQIPEDIFVFKHDSLRTTRGRSWQDAIYSLLEIAPLIIVDTRTPTPNLDEEIRYIWQRKIFDKAIFIKSNDGNLPAIERAGVDIRGVPLSLCRVDGISRAVTLHMYSTGPLSTTVEEIAEKGVELALKKKDHQAIAFLELALDSLKDKANIQNVLSQLSACYSRIGKHDKADHYWMLLHKSGISEPKFWSNRAVNLLRAGNENGAIAAFENRIKIDNDMPSKMAVSLIREGKGHTLIR